MSNADTQAMGYHAIIEHTGAISRLNIAGLESLLRAAADAAGATVLEAKFHDFGDGLGNTGVVLLAESHISIHTWPEHNYAAIDIFVCSDRDSIEAAVRVLSLADQNGIFDCRILQRAVPGNGAPHTSFSKNNAELTQKSQNNRRRNEVH